MPNQPTTKALCEGMVERVARALCKSAGRDPDSHGVELIGGRLYDCPQWKTFTCSARAAIGAVDAALTEGE